MINMCLQIFLWSPGLFDAAIQTHQSIIMTFEEVLPPHLQNIHPSHCKYIAFGGFPLYILSLEEFNMSH